MASTYLEKEMDAEMKELESEEEMDDSEDDKRSGNIFTMHYLLDGVKIKLTCHLQNTSSTCMP